MVKPILRVMYPIESRSLDIDILIRRIEAQHCELLRSASHRAGNIDALEIWRCYKVDVLPRIRKQAHHSKSDKAAHCSGIVIAGKTALCWLKKFRDIEVTPQRGQSGPTCIVVLEDGQESRLVTDVCDAVVVKIVQTLHESCRPTKVAYQTGLIVRDEEAVLPDA